MSADPLLGTKLGACRLDALVGRGGMGRVYKAFHLDLERTVAVKLMDAGAGAGTTQEALREQIIVEARTAAKLEDPRCVAIYEVGESRGIPYIVMQWVDGESLEGRVKRAGKLKPQEALAIIKETAAALGAAHAAGLVHRDVKPGNILIDSKGAVKLTDFGIARPAGKAMNEAVAGSFHFMAPEQAVGGPPDPRSDLYALGATWYYALTGLPPYPGSALDALTRHRDEPPPEVRIQRPEVTERASNYLKKLMAKSPDERPKDAAEVVAGLSAAGILLEVDTSGSPFKILPAPPRVELSSPPAPAAINVALPPTAKTQLATNPGVAPQAPNAAVASKFAAMPALPAPAAPQAALGSRSSFFLIIGVFGVIAFGWQWRRAGAEDWAAGAGMLALLPGALTFGGARWSAARKALGVLGSAGALACWARFAFAAGVAAPALEAAILAGVGAVSLFGAVYLGQWGQDRSEAVWARLLSPVAGLSLLLSALTWTTPESQAWTAALAERGAAWFAAMAASGGGWRWIGTSGLAAAMAAAAQLNLPEKAAEAPKDRRLNWNK